MTKLCQGMVLFIHFLLRKQNLQIKMAILHRSITVIHLDVFFFCFFKQIAPVHDAVCLLQCSSHAKIHTKSLVTKSLCTVCYFCCIAMLIICHKCWLADCAQGSGLHIGNIQPCKSDSQNIGSGYSQSKEYPQTLLWSL